MKEIFELQADICKTMANAKRLEIISLLGEGELPVGEIAEKMEVRLSNLSQHLAIMKAKGILEARRDGVHIYYRLSNPKVTRACTLMKEVLMEQMEARAAISKRGKLKGAII
jgi:ArsR family transcriptional regulator